MSGASMTMESVVTRFHYRRLPVSSKTKCIFDGYEMCCKYSVRPHILLNIFLNAKHVLNAKIFLVLPHAHSQMPICRTEKLPVVPSLLMTLIRKRV